MTQKFNGTYDVTFFIPERGSYSTSKGTMLIATKTDGSDEVLLPECRLSFMNTQFQLSGRIKDQTGLATISGQAIDASYKLDPSPWTFVDTQALKSVSAARVVFNGAPAIGFCFSLFGTREGVENFESQIIPDLFLDNLRSTSNPAAKL